MEHSEPDVVSQGTLAGDKIAALPSKFSKKHCPTGTKELMYLF